MKRPMLIVAVILAMIILAASYVLIFNQSDDELSSGNSPTTTTIQDQEADPEVPAQTAGSGSYIDYVPGVIEQTAGTKVLFFHANWCPQCRALEADIQESGLPSGVTVIKVDFDNSQDLREKYGVTQQTTLVKVDDGGNLQQKFVAYQEPSVASLEENLL